MWLKKDKDDKDSENNEDSEDSENKVRTPVVLHSSPPLSPPPKKTPLAGLLLLPHAPSPLKIQSLYKSAAILGVRHWLITALVIAEQGHLVGRRPDEPSDTTCWVMKGRNSGLYPPLHFSLPQLPPGGLKTLDSAKSQLEVCVVSICISCDWERLMIQ